MHVWNVRHVARWKCRTQKSPKMRHLGTIVQHCRTISSHLRHLSTIGKIVKQQYTSSTFPDNTVSFGPLAEICWRVWGTPVNFNGFRVLVASLHGTLVLGISKLAALNRGRHLYSAGRPSHWASAHISSLHFFFPRRPNLSGRRLDVYHTLAHGVALVRI